MSGQKAVDCTVAEDSDIIGVKQVAQVQSWKVLPVNIMSYKISEDIAQNTEDMWNNAFPNGVLCFIFNKINVMLYDLVVKVCTFIQKKTL